MGKKVLGGGVLGFSYTLSKMRRAMVELLWEDVTQTLQTVALAVFS